MINTTGAYKSAVIADERQVEVKALARIVDPDVQYGLPTAEPYFYKSDLNEHPHQLTDEDMHSGDIYATLEKNRWVLDGNMRMFPTPLRLVNTQVGFVSTYPCDDDGMFGQEPYAHVPFTGVDSLQACTVVFSDRGADGVASDFWVDVYVGSAVVAQQHITNNTQSTVFVTGFNISGATAIRLRIVKWTIPSRRARVLELQAGALIEWIRRDITDINVLAEADLSALRLPNGECKLSTYSADKIFNPFTANSLYTALEARQSVDVSIGVVLADRTVEYVPAGRFYVQNRGWKITDDGVGVTFDLTDLIGLVKDRTFHATSLPWTLSGWIKAVLSTLGSNFENRYTIDNDVPEKTLQVHSFEDVNGKKCGDILLWLAQASLGFMRCDKTTGNIRVSAWPTAVGTTLSRANMSDYPTAEWIGDVAYVTVKYGDSDGGGEYKISGSSNQATDLDKTINNPFIRPNTTATTIIANMYRCHGISEMTVKGRGRPESELGDIDGVEMWPDTVITGYLMYQNLSVNDGVLESTTKHWEVKP